VGLPTPPRSLAGKFSVAMASSAQTFPLWREIPPIDYDSEEDRERSAWEWDEPDASDQLLQGIEDDSETNGRVDDPRKAGSRVDQHTDQTFTSIGASYDQIEHSELIASTLAKQNSDGKVDSKSPCSVSSTRITPSHGAVIVEGYKPFSLENRAPVLVHSVPSRLVFTCLYYIFLNLSDKKQTKSLLQLFGMVGTFS
jgi:hypothetical protein